MRRVVVGANAVNGKVNGEDRGARMWHAGFRDRICSPQGLERCSAGMCNSQHAVATTSIFILFLRRLLHPLH
jgi:hypothetical protein